MPDPLEFHTLLVISRQNNALQENEEVEKAISQKLASVFGCFATSSRKASYGSFV